MEPEGYTARSGTSLDESLLHWAAESAATVEFDETTGSAMVAAGVDGI